MGSKPLGREEAKQGTLEMKALSRFLARPQKVYTPNPITDTKDTWVSGERENVGAETSRI